MVEHRPLTTQATQSMATLTLSQNMTLSSHAITNTESGGGLDVMSQEDIHPEYRKQF